MSISLGEQKPTVLDYGQEKPCRKERSSGQEMNKVLSKVTGLGVWSSFVVMGFNTIFQINEGSGTYEQVYDWTNAWVDDRSRGG